jgi:hypothetical protein
MEEFLPFLKTQLKPAEIQKLSDSVSTMTQIFAMSDEETHSRFVVTKSDIKVDVICKIIRKNAEMDVSYVKLLGFGENVYILSSNFFVLQNYNLCFYIKNLNWDAENKFFFFDGETTRMKALYISDFQPTVVKFINSLGNPYDPLHNFNAVNAFDNNMIQPEDLAAINSRDSIDTLKGIIVKRIKTKEMIILKLVDLRNLIDTFKLLITIKDEQELNKFYVKLQLNLVLTVKHQIKQMINKKSKLIYCIQLPSITRFGLTEQKTDFTKLKLNHRIQQNISFARFFLTELVNLHPYYFHRGIIQLIFKINKVIYLDMKLFCSTCKKKANLCSCEEPVMDRVSIFCTLHVQNSDLTLYASVKKWNLFQDIFEMTERERQTIMKYLKVYGELRYSFGETIHNTPKRDPLMASVEKMVGDKIVFGYLHCKPQAQAGGYFMSEGREIAIPEGAIYPNGIIKNTRNGSLCIFDFKIKHVVHDSKEIVNRKFELLMNKLLI